MPACFKTSQLISNVDDLWPSTGGAGPAHVVVRYPLGAIDQCENVAFTGPEFVTLVELLDSFDGRKTVVLGEVNGVYCVRDSHLIANVDDVVEASAPGVPVVPYTIPRAMIFDGTSVVDRCQFVAISGHQYQDLVSRVEALQSPPVSGGGAEVGVGADIFVGVALVVCLIGGWIAGAQR